MTLGPVLLAGLLWAGHAGAADAVSETASDMKPESGPPPVWATTNLFPRLPLTAFQAGEEQRLLLVERQINVRDGITFHHVARQLLTVAGVQNGSTVSIDFDPSYQALTLHSVKVWRGTNATEHLDLARVSTIRREQDLDRYLFNGESSAVLVLKDVRVRDIVEFSYSVRGTNPVFEGKFFGKVPVQYPVPVHRLLTRVLWPTARKLQLRNHACVVVPQKRLAGEITEYVWDFRNVAALPDEDSLPAWADAVPWVQLSEFQSWSEVAKWAVSLFAGDAPLPAELQAKVREWKRRENPEQQVASALRFIQDEIRYFGVEMGSGSHRPSAPDEVFRRRFGDCKDKTLLFVRVVRALGFEAQPVLVNSRLRKGIAPWHPTPAAFDHAIACVRLPSGTFWLDPTAGYQRGSLKSHYLPDLGQGLVVAANVSALSVIPAATVDSATVMSETYEVGRPGMKSALKVVTVGTGRDAETLRELFASSPRDEIEKAYLEYQAKAHTGIVRNGPITVADDEAANRFTIMESYGIPEIWTRSERNRQLVAEFYPYALAARLAKPAATSRRLPLGVRFPEHLTVRTEVRWPGPIFLNPDQANLTSTGFRFRRDLRHDGLKTVLEQEYQALQDFVPADQYRRHLQEVGRATDLLGLAVRWQ